MTIPRCTLHHRISANHRKIQRTRISASKGALRKYWNRMRTDPPGCQEFQISNSDRFLIETLTNKGKCQIHIIAALFVCKLSAIRKLSDRQPTPRLCVNRNAKVHRKRLTEYLQCLHYTEKEESHVDTTDFDPFQTLPSTFIQVKLS